MAGYINNYGYRFIVVYEDGKRRKVLEHRYVMEQHLERVLTTDEIIHHINGDKLDNRLENLEVMARKAHGQHHHPRTKPAHQPRSRPWNKGNHLPATMQGTCDVCGSLFERSTVPLRFRLRHGLKIVCSPVCRARLGVQMRYQKHS